MAVTSMIPKPAYIISISFLTLLISIFFVVVAAAAINCYDTSATQENAKTLLLSSNYRFMWVGVGVGFVAILMSCVLIAAGFWYRYYYNQASQLIVKNLKSASDTAVNAFPRNISIVFNSLFLLVGIYFIAVSAIGINCSQDVPNAAYSANYMIMVFGLVFGLVLIILVSLSLWLNVREKTDTKTSSIVKDIVPNILQFPEQRKAQ